MEHSKFESNSKTKNFFTDVRKYYTDDTDIGKASKIITGMSRYYVFVMNTT